jgi:hypothetical protein
MGDGQKGKADMSSEAFLTSIALAVEAGGVTKPPSRDTGIFLPLLQGLRRNAVQSVGISS